MLCLFLNTGSSRKEEAIADTITIITEGSSAIGFGHLRRSISLARELSRCVSVRLSILGAKCGEALPDEALEHVRGVDWKAVADIPADDSDVQILDLDQANHKRYMNHPNLGKNRCLALDWFESLWLPAITVNLLDHSGKMRVAYESAGRAGDYLDGPDYAIIRQGILALRTQAPTVGKVVKIVITMGGADPSRRTLEAVQMLQTLPDPVCVTVIVGPLVPLEYEKIIRAGAPKIFRLLRNPPDFDRHLAEADVVLCSGGGTLLESLSLGKPTVVFPQNEAEEAHGRMHLQAGACVFADSLTLLLREHALRFALAKNARRQVDGRGVARIAQAVLELMCRADEQSIQL